MCILKQNKKIKFSSLELKIIMLLFTNLNKVNTIIFNRKKEKLLDIIEKSKQKIASVCDLRNIQIIVDGENKNAEIICDISWQVEALTNILKNCVEHSKNNTRINIYYSENKMYSEIIIKDEGSGIDKDDLKHIFERFYKGNDNKDSIGIGLNMSKKIINLEQGIIEVETKENVGSTFIIKLYKNNL